MEQRKLIKLGNSSFAIALPKPWVSKAGLKKGDKIFLEENGNGEIIMSPVFKKLNGGRKAEININQGLDFIRKEASAAYVNGYDSIIFKGKKSKARKSLTKDILNGLLGFEIVGENDEEVISKDFFNLEDINMNNFIRRIDNNIREIFEIIKRGIEKEKLAKKDLKEIENADKDINKFCLLCSRLYIKGTDNPSMLNLLKINGLSLFNFWWLAFNLEQMGDRTKEIAKILVIEGVKGEESKKIYKIFLELEDNYTKSIESAYKNDKSVALQALDEGFEIFKKCEKLSLSEKSTVAKLAVKFNDIQRAVYQNTKIVLYLIY